MSSPDLKKSLAELKGGGRASDRRRVSMYFSESVYSEFKKVCDAEGVSVNKLIEKWMRDSLKASKGRR